MLQYGTFEEVFPLVDFVKNDENLYKEYKEMEKLAHQDKEKVIASFNEEKKELLKKTDYEFYWWGVKIFLDHDVLIEMSNKAIPALIAMIIVLFPPLAPFSPVFAGTIYLLIWMLIRLSEGRGVYIDLTWAGVPKDWGQQ